MTNTTIALALVPWSSSAYDNVDRTTESVVNIKYKYNRSEKPPGKQTVLPAEGFLDLRRLASSVGVENDDRETDAIRFGSYIQTYKRTFSGSNLDTKVVDIRGREQFRMCGNDYSVDLRPRGAIAKRLCPVVCKGQVWLGLGQPPPPFSRAYDAGYTDVE